MPLRYDRTTCVLVVDDEEDSLELLRRSLARMGLEVLPAKSASEALLVLATEHVDLIVADMVMAGRSGIDLLREARELGFRMPFIMVTAYGEMDSYIEVMNLGAVEYLSKPINQDHLVQIVARTVGAQAVAHT